MARPYSQPNVARHLLGMIKNARKKRNRIESMFHVDICKIVYRGTVIYFDGDEICSLDNEKYSIIENDWRYKAKNIEEYLQSFLKQTSI